MFHYNIDIHSRRLNAKLPGDEEKCIEKLQSHYANMNFAEKQACQDFQLVTNKGGESAMNYIKIFQDTQALSV